VRIKIDRGKLLSGFIRPLLQRANATNQFSVNPALRIESGLIWLQHGAWNYRQYHQGHSKADAAGALLRIGRQQTRSLCCRWCARIALERLWYRWINQGRTQGSNDDL